MYKLIFTSFLVMLFAIAQFGTVSSQTAGSVKEKIKKNVDTASVPMDSLTDVVRDVIKKECPDHDSLNIKRITYNDKLAYAFTCVTKDETTYYIVDQDGKTVKEKVMNKMKDRQKKNKQEKKQAGDTSKTK